jgi:hypothetical protein
VIPFCVIVLGRLLAWFVGGTCGALVSEIKSLTMCSGCTGGGGSNSEESSGVGGGGITGRKSYLIGVVPATSLDVDEGSTLDSENSF